MTVVLQNHKAGRKKQPRQFLPLTERTDNLREDFQKSLTPKTGWAHRNTFFPFSDCQYFDLAVELKKNLALPEMSHSTKTGCFNFILTSFSSLKQINKIKQ